MGGVGWGWVWWGRCVGGVGVGGDHIDTHFSHTIPHRHSVEGHENVTSFFSDLHVRFGTYFLGLGHVPLASVSGKVVL